MVSKYILIISCDRSGGKALMYALSDKLNIPWIDWMFNPQPHHPGYDQMKDGKVWIERPKKPVVQHTILSEHQQDINNTPHFNSKTLLEYSKGFTDIILLDRRDIKEVADALTDILYVTYGAGHAFGINLDKCFEEVQNSNMSKLGEDGKPIYNDKGKVMKGPNYFKPNLNKFVA